MPFQFPLKKYFKGEEIRKSCYTCGADNCYSCSSAMRGHKLCASPKASTLAGYRQNEAAMMHSTGWLRLNSQDTTAPHSTLSWKSRVLVRVFDCSKWCGGILVSGDDEPMSGVESYCRRGGIGGINDGSVEEWIKLFRILWSVNLKSQLPMTSDCHRHPGRALE
jgi:hypothetical protein